MKTVGKVIYNERKLVHFWDMAFENMLKVSVKWAAVIGIQSIDVRE